MSSWVLFFYYFFVLEYIGLTCIIERTLLKLWWKKIYPHVYREWVWIRGGVVVRAWAREEKEKEDQCTSHIDCLANNKNFPRTPIRVQVHTCTRFLPTKPVANKSFAISIPWYILVIDVVFRITCGVGWVYYSLKYSQVGIYK